MHAEGRVQGVLGLGGSCGTATATAAMRTLPVGLPKVMVSTMASGQVAPYVGEKDVTLMYSVVDIAGLNRISRRILANGVGAVCGMFEQELSEQEDRPLVAATMFGVTTPCVERVRERLEAAGFEVLVFHATGSGGRAMEGLIDAGFFAGVADALGLVAALASATFRPVEPGDSTRWWPCARTDMLRLRCDRRATG